MKQWKLDETCTWIKTLPCIWTMMHPVTHSARHLIFRGRNNILESLNHQSFCLLALWTLANYLDSLTLSFLIYKMEVKCLAYNRHLTNGSYSSYQNRYHVLSIYYVPGTFIRGLNALTYLTGRDHNGGNRAYRMLEWENNFLNLLK